MSSNGADMQSTNNQLIAIIEDLREKRAEVDRLIAKDEEEKQRITTDLRTLNEKLARLDEGLARKYSARQDYDKTISETENAFHKILESSKTLLTVLKKEQNTLVRKSGS